MPRALTFRAGARQDLLSGGGRGVGRVLGPPSAAGGGLGVPPCPGLSHLPGLAARRGPAGGGRGGAVSLRWQWSLLQPSPPRWQPCASYAIPVRPKWTGEAKAAGGRDPP